MTKLLCFISIYIFLFRKIILQLHMLSVGINTAIRMTKFISKGCDYISAILSLNDISDLFTMGSCLIP